MTGNPIAAQIAAQRGHLFLWVPVAMAVGIGAYFAVPEEPSGLMLGVACTLGLLAAVLSRRGSETSGPLWAALALILLAFGWAGARAHLVAAPVLEFRFYGPIEGRIVQIDRSISDKLRLTLDQVTLGDLSHRRTPARVRISLHGLPHDVAPVTGLRVMTTGHLGPPSAPVEPGGFDFRRHAWFQQIGAVGYTRNPVLVVARPDAHSPAVWLGQVRLSLSARLQARIPGQAGAMAAAIVTGDRSALSRETMDAMRNSNLAHLLAISGLHVGLLTGVVFGAVRAAIALIPPLALRWPGKKIAAVCALLAAAGYLALSGGSVSTQRAFIMVAVMLAAVLADRRAITLRAVALAATIVLVLRPEALMGPGFQMSFAATTALVWTFGWLREIDLPRVWRPLRVIGTLVLSSAVAGLATAPFAAAHFNQIASYGLMANLLAVPVMGSMVAPAAVLAGLLGVMGLAQPALWIMGQGITWILAVADHVAGLQNALKFVPSPPASFLPVFALGALWLMLWRSRAAVIGLAVIGLAFGLWSRVERPFLLIAETGGLVGVMTEAGRALNKPRGDGYAALAWLENDGRNRDRIAAFDRAQENLDGKALRMPLGLGEMRWASGRKADCAQARVLVTPTSDIIGSCLILDPDALRKSGALAVWRRQDGWHVAAAKIRAGNRLWSHAGQKDAAQATQVVDAVRMALNAPPGQ
ncbi:ComEC/Rec2 family competence protein [Fluviibacterium sp. DFM31]|uniref:ComEC/Rec2 family competence protein n=1 Tax=Meridianimarinicoccus marinus TaxID=3231483 RepID=A0ABV3L7E6_9RHOB